MKIRNLRIYCQKELGVVIDKLQFIQAELREHDYLLNAENDTYQTAQSEPIYDI